MNLRNWLVDYLKPIDQGKRVTADFPTRWAVVTPRVAMTICIVITILTLGAITAVVWTSTPQVSMSTVRDAVVAGSTPEATETPTEMRGGPGQEINPQAQAGPLIVSVMGSVVNSGVVEASAGAWVVEAIDRTGGFLPEANPASMNLTTPLVDDQQIVVGTEVLPAGTAGDGAGASGGSGTDAAGVAGPGGSDGKVNINIASATQLEELPGIGSIAATKIIDFREENGAFASIDALEEVPGIGPTKVEVLRDVATV